MPLEAPEGKSEGFDLAPFIAILAVAISGNAFVALSPLFVGAMADFWGMSAPDIGALVSYEFSGTSVATVLGIFFLHRPHWPLRQTAFGALGLFALVNVLTPFVVEQKLLLIALRVLSGLCAGFTWITSATALAHLKQNKRILPLFYGSPFFTGMVFQPIMPSLFKAWGVSAGYFLIAGMAAFTFLLYRAYLERNPDRIEDTSAAAPASSLVQAPMFALVLGSLTIQFVANTGLWTYFERVGASGGHDAQTTANVLSVALAFALAGSLLASAMAERAPPISAILISTGLISVSTLLLLASHNLAAFLIAASLFNLMITFITPFYFIVLEQNFDPAKGAILGNIAMIVGFSAGPVAIGATIKDDSYLMAVIATLVLFAASAAMIATYAALKRKTPPSAALAPDANAT